MIVQYSFVFSFRMALDSFGIKLTGDKGINDTINPWTDYNRTRSPNFNSKQTAFMGDHKLQGQETWIPITVVLVICLFAIGIIIKKRNWFHEKMMGLIEVIYTCMFKF